MTVSFFTGSKFSFKEEEAISTIEMERINSRIAVIKDMVATDHKYNQKVVFLIDMKVPSGKNRLFFYDFQKD